MALKARKAEDKLPVPPPNDSVAASEISLYRNVLKIRKEHDLEEQPLHVHRGASIRSEPYRKRGLEAIFRAPGRPQVQLAGAPGPAAVERDRRPRNRAALRRRRAGAHRSNGVRFSS